MMYMQIDDQKLRIKRSEEHPGGMYWPVDGPNASCVFEVAYRAKQESEKKHGYIYKVLKRGGKELTLNRNNQYADALIFAGTGICNALKEKYDEGYSEDDYSLLYAS